MEYNSIDAIDDHIVYCGTFSAERVLQTLRPGDTPAIQRVDYPAAITPPSQLADRLRVLRNRLLRHHRGYGSRSVQ